MDVRLREPKRQHSEGTTLDLPSSSGPNRDRQNNRTAAPAIAPTWEDVMQAFVTVCHDPENKPLTAMEVLPLHLYGQRTV